MAGQRRILFVVDPLADLKPAKDSSIAMMRELALRGHEVWACEVADLSWSSQDESRVGAATQRLHLETAPSGAGDASPLGWARIVDRGRRALVSFDAVLMRKDPPFDTEFLYATHLLQAAQRAGARVFNDPRALRDHNEKFATTEFDRFCVSCLVTRDLDALRAFHRKHEDIVVKPLDGMGGRSIFRLRADDPNLNVILETVTEFGERTVMAQRYIPEIRAGDKRILLIGGRPAPFALARIPKPGESRGNLAAGGTGKAQPLSARDLEIANALGPVLAARGLLLVGLDVIGDYLTEINVTSPTCFVEIQDQSGFNVAAMLVDALEASLAAAGSS
jgi:glutathione synthase